MSSSVRALCMAVGAYDLALRNLCVKSRYRTAKGGEI